MTSDGIDLDSIDFDGARVSYKIGTKVHRNDTLPIDRDRCQVCTLRDVLQ